jgi:serine/threonine protein kinase/Flp pilus assembly protein TadD
MSVERMRASDSGSGLTDDQTSRVIHILEAYLVELERGGHPHPDDLVARHPELAGVLRPYLQKLEILHHAAAGLRSPPDEALLGYLAPERGRLGDFRILREIGRGGMGIVYEAEQISLGRHVALKVLPLAPALDGRQLQRFRNEARAAAHLHHTNIVPVHAVGSDRSVHYYAMQYIEGRSLATLIAELRRQAGKKEQGSGIGDQESGIGSQGSGARDQESGNGDWSGAFKSAETHKDEAIAQETEVPLPRSLIPDPRSAISGSSFYRTVAQLGVQAAEALEHAHQQSVIHRDIKPANLLLDERVHLWVTDFGLARCGAENGLTLTGALVGTLRYMSPEQALGKRGRVDHRTDIYSLGVTLYELLTLEPAYGGSDRHELLRQIAFEEPQPARKVNPAIPRELETILLKAMAKEPEGRYGSAQDLADDLRRFLEHRPIRARRPTLRERLHKWARRHRSVVMSALTLLIMAVLGLVVGAILIWREQELTKAALREARWQWHRAKINEGEANVQRRRAEAHFRKACHGVTRLLLRLEERRWTRRPELRELRQTLAEQGLEFFQSFLDENNPDPVVRHETGSVYVVLAGVYAMQGRTAEVEKAYGKAVAIFGRLAAEFPDDQAYRHGLGLGHNLLGLALHEAGRKEMARAEFRRAVACYRQALLHRPDCRTPNDLAWLLATCPQAEFRNPAEAVVLARQAVQMSPTCGPLWNTLGVAQYRAGQWKAAVGSLRESMRLRGGGDSSDWLFLAMAYWQLGDKVQAHEWCDRARQDVQKDPLCEPLARYRDEAEALLGLVGERRKENG